MPREWRDTTLGEVGRYINGRGFKKSEWSDRGRPIIRIQDLTGTGTAPNFFAGEADERHVVRRGDLLVSWAATLDAFMWNGPEAVLNQHIFKVESAIDRRFHFHLVKHVLADIRRRAHGSGMVHITKGEFERTPIRIPTATEEQSLIADAIELQMSRLEVAETVLRRSSKRLAAYRESATSWAATGGKRASAGRGDDGRLRVPDHWRWAKLGEVAEIVGGVTKDQKRAALADAVEVPYLRVANVQRGYLDLHEMKTIRATAKEVAGLRLKSGDVLFNEGGDRDKLGRGWVWEGQIDPCIHQNHVFRARLSRDDLDPRFVSWYANTIGRDYFLKHGKQTTNLASINRTQLAQLPIPLPPSIEQEEIVEELERQLSVLNALETEVQAALVKGSRLREAVLSTLLLGDASASTGGGAE